MVFNLVNFFSITKKKENRSSEKINILLVPHRKNNLYWKKKSHGKKWFLLKMLVFLFHFFFHIFRDGK